MQLCFVSAIYTFLSFKARRAIFLAGSLSNSIVADVISSEVHVLSLCSRFTMKRQKTMFSFLSASEGKKSHR